MLRIAIITMLAVIAGLAVASGVLLTAVAHDKPLHRAYACQFGRDLRQEDGLPPAPCRYPSIPVTCHFDGGGTSVAGSVTRTDNGRPWLCTDDGNLVPWAGHLPTSQNN